MADSAVAFPNILEHAYDTVSYVRDEQDKGLRDWNDAWSNFMVNYALSEYEFKNNKEMWNLMNEYNSPQAQMQRFKEAGLNPMLIYQQGTPGNASSPVQYSKPNIQFTPNEARNKDLNAKIGAAMDIIGVVSNLAENIGGMIDQSYNLQLKRNEVIDSNFQRSLMNYAFPYEPGNMPRLNYAFIEDYLNPLSGKFDPMAYMAFQRNGQLPQFINQYLSADAARQLQGFKSQYQQYYNENILPKFNEYQQGKLNLQDIEEVMKGYERDTMTMIPAPFRGIIEPLLQWIAPFVKFIFKSSKIHVNSPIP